MAASKAARSIFLDLHRSLNTVISSPTTLSNASAALLLIGIMSAETLMAPRAHQQQASGEFDETEQPFLFLANTPFVHERGRVSSFLAASSVSKTVLVPISHRQIN